MKAWIAQNFGHLQEEMMLVERGRPRATPSGAVIKIRAIGLNFRDILTIAGKYQEKPNLPFVPGVEAAGEIIETGQDCALKKGERVMSMGEGAFAQYMLAPRVSTFPIPKSMSYEDAASFQMIYQTAYFALVHRARLEKSETLLVNGGAGGVGTAAIQVGKTLGAKVIACTGRDEKKIVCKESGADYVINYHENDVVKEVMDITEGKGADVIFDPVGGDLFEKSMRCIAWEGRVLVIGFASGVIPKVPANRILLKNIDVLGLYWGNYRKHNLDLINRTQETLYEMYEAGNIKPVIFNVFPFAELPEALECLESQQSYGKIVVRVDGA
jgi:NADPH2:quinone reductase